VAAGQFIIGGSKVHPNVNVSFSRDKMMGIYFQVYNLGLDEKTHKPSATIEYVLRKGEKEVSRFMEEQDKLTGASPANDSGKALPVKDLEPGRYSLVVNVTDNLTKRHDLAGCEV
jgi:hypothetical protein